MPNINVKDKKAFFFLETTQWLPLKGAVDVNLSYPLFKEVHLLKDVEKIIVFLA